MTETGRVKRWMGMLTSAVVILLMGLMLTSSAAAIPVGTPPGASWAYGGSRSDTATGTVTTSMGGSSEYSVQTHSAWTVVFNETNTTNSTFMVEGVRTLGFSFGVTFCNPSCSNPTQSIKMNATGWDREVAFANFTRNGTVYVGGQATQAVAFMNLSANGRSNMTVTASWSGQHTGNAYASAASTTQAALAFTPPLGLFPHSPSQGEKWNSSSNYTGQADWSGSAYLHTSSGTSMSRSFAGNLSHSGILNLTGTYSGTQHLANGMNAGTMGISLGKAPFRLADGIFMLPMGGDMFGGMMKLPWMGMLGPLGEQIATGDVDFVPGLGHIGIMAAQTIYAPQATMMNTTMMGGGGMGGGGMGGSPAPMGVALTAPTSTGSLPSQPLQAQPMSVASAENLAASILSPQTASSGSSSLHHLLPIILVAVVALTAALLVAYYMIEGPRRQRPANLTPEYREAVNRPPRKTGETGDRGKEKDPLSYLM